MQSRWQSHKRDNDAVQRQRNYDSYGPYGFSIDGTFYYYVKNLQGDVTQIRDENNNLIASYVYDAWGKVLSVTENNTNNIGAKNAIRYRGYYYDAESNLYYLNARYYDPQIKRFINPDAILGANGGLVGYNMYAYCNNDPVDYSDLSGNRMVLRPEDAIVKTNDKVEKNQYEEKPYIENFKNSDGTYSLMDNRRLHKNNPLHSQLIVFGAETPEFDLTEGDVTLGTYTFCLAI